MNEIVVDNFAGGGGASTGIEIAIGRSVDIAINHDPAAIAMHRANHPTTEHYTEDVWKVDPVEAPVARSLSPGSRRTASITPRPRAESRSARRFAASRGWL